MRYRGRTGRVDAISGDILTLAMDAGDRVQIVATFRDLRVMSAWDEGRLSPPRTEIDNPETFSPPLTKGELELVDMLDATLEPEWRIYVRPHLDAERPLLAAVHPDRGAMIWDVVDWRRADIRTEGEIWRVSTIDGERMLRSPLRYLDDVRAKLYGTYIPAMGEAINEDPRRFRFIRAGLYFCNESTASVQDLGRGKWIVFGRDAVIEHRLASVMPIRDRQAGWDPLWADELDQTLGFVHRAGDFEAAFRLTPEQERLSQPGPGTHVITGVAGSGKSVVIANRAARIAGTGRRALVVTYNRTLTNYIRAILRGVPVRYRTSNLTVLHFHGLLRQAFNHYREMPPPYKGDDHREGDDDWTELQDAGDSWVEQALLLLQTRTLPDLLHFDALLIDEGQDFSHEYVAVLRQLFAHADDPEVVIAHDPAQRIYNRVAVLADGGPWKDRVHRGSLKRGHRLPPAGAAFANAFSTLHGLETEPIEVPEDGLFPGTCRWVPTESDAHTMAEVVRQVDAWGREPHFNSGRAVVLVSSKTMGMALVRLLWEHGHQTNHVFAVLPQGESLDQYPTGGTDVERGPDWVIAQTRKKAFAYADRRLKISTIHSFKGWDADRVVVALAMRPSERTVRDLNESYVSITRAREDVVLVGPGHGLGLEQLPIERATPGADLPVVQRAEVLLTEPKRRKRPAARNEPSLDEPPAPKPPAAETGWGWEEDDHPG